MAPLQDIIVTGKLVHQVHSKTASILKSLAAYGVTHIIVPSHIQKILDQIIKNKRLGLTCIPVMRSKL